LSGIWELRFGETTDTVRIVSKGLAMKRGEDKACQRLLHCCIYNRSWRADQTKQTLWPSSFLSVLGAISLSLGSKHSHYADQQS